MARTTAMRLIELMIFRQDIRKVLKYLGEMGDFQFQQDFDASSDTKAANPAQDVFDSLQQARTNLGIEDLTSFKGALCLPADDDGEKADKIVTTVAKIHQDELDAAEEEKRASAEYKEALAFSNLQVSYSDLESLSFLTLRIGKIEPEKFDELKKKAGFASTIVALGDDKSRVLAATSKKGRFALDGVLKECGFVEIEIPKDFKGIPENVLETLKLNSAKAQKALEEIQEERKNYAETHKDELYRLLQCYSVAKQISEVENNLESTEYIYRITGWIPAYEAKEVSKKIDELTDKRSAVREYMPSEVPSVLSGEEKVPVQVKHGPVIKNFERMIFSYGSPLYGTIDPTPFVAVFFTVLFGIMFGDAGQGLCFLIIGILSCLKKIKFSGWEKFGPVLCCIGVSSTIMGILTGEFFANETILEPFSLWVTGLFGTPHAPILHMMPSSDPSSITRMFAFFGFTIGVGFLINTCGLIINISNQMSLKRWGKAFFGKTGISGAVFFWYVVAFALRVAFFKHVPQAYDYVIIIGTLLISAFGEPLERLVEKESPVLENGLLSAIIGAVVEIIEIVSSYLSNTVSFVRVGAFALAHAVLGYIINSLVEITPGAGGIAVSIVGNAIVVVLEGMIVAIQVVRLQYYEFFSKFFSETGREFKPFRFEYK
ncbi:MAG: V-type ATPase 116kDa subunit family protein [Treponema sp.]|nr:ATPase [Spirochaetia bacterium]MDD7460022.1 V-type ATPase 116kDa subunit family protein [Spirochaetales bacterium]MDY5810618.1 V-type ATPase 116kDa subunit family protein [Treponema sp.]MEE1181356.1 V-type ATPase 116kDa subunit family protein [Treponema sp.]